MGKIMNVMMLSCRKATELMEKKLDKKLSTTETFQLKLHISMCKACSDYQSHTTMIDAAMKDECDQLPQVHEECEELKMRILKDLENEENKEK
ncbi:MAG: zf-HC2 domain-containing protein [Flavobacteriales bacterium]|nr:zf-HC2 domain-containing protein [Flavobacteriales bacterium]